MQNSLVSHNYLFLSWLYLQSSIWPREGNMELQMGWGHRTSLFCSSFGHLWTALPYKISHFTFPTLSSCSQHKLLWTLVFDGLCTTFGVKLSPMVMDLPVYAAIQALKLLPWVPQNDGCLSQKSHRCKLQQDPSSQSGPRGTTTAEMNIPVPKKRKCQQCNTYS